MFIEHKTLDTSDLFRHVKHAGYYRNISEVFLKYLG